MFAVYSLFVRDDVFRVAWRNFDTRRFPISRYESWTITIGVQIISICRKARELLRGH